MNTKPLGDSPSVEELGQVEFDPQLPEGVENMGTVRGINVETGDELWLHEQRAATLSVTATGGGLLFGGDVNRRFRAYDQETGDILWETILGAPVSGFPISYAVDGKQYVAVAAGNALITGGYLGLTPEIKVGPGSNQLYVFALPGQPE
jgi:alcohol dehydrogenase (cytochrome c)